MGRFLIKINPTLAKNLLDSTEAFVGLKIKCIAKEFSKQFPRFGQYTPTYAFCKVKLSLPNHPIFSSPFGKRDMMSIIKETNTIT